MQNRIAYYIVSLLYLNGKVRIPGIGKITHLREQSAVNTANATVVPPQAHGLFIQDKNSKNQLLEKYIAYQSHVSRTKARREIARFTDQVQTGIQNEGKIELKYLGTFSLEDDAMQFSPNEEILNPGHSSLQRITLPERLLSIEEESMPYAAKDSAFPEMGSVGVADETSPYEEHPSEDPGPTESLPQLIAEQTDFQPQPESMAGKEPIQFGSAAEQKTVIDDVTKDEVVVTPTPIPFVIPEAQKTSTPVVDSTVDRTGEKTIPVSKETPPAEGRKKRDVPLAFPIAAVIMLGLLAVAFLFYQSRISHQESAILIDSTLTDDKEQTVSPSEQIDHNEDATGIIPESDPKIALGDTGIREEVGEDQIDETEIVAEVETPVEVETPSNTNQEAIYAATGECLIILGAFSVESNVQRMADRLRAMGYTTLTQPRGSLTQVGIPVDCKAQNLQMVLGFLRKNVEQQAWVLRPH